MAPGREDCDKQPMSPDDANPTPFDADPAPLSLVARAPEAATFLKAMGHDGRLLILCHLCHGPKSVTELENLLDQRQAAVSQQLARLRLEGMVRARRDGQAIYYSILDPRVGAAIALLARLFHDPAAEVDQTEADQTERDRTERDR